MMKTENKMSPNHLEWGDWRQQVQAAARSWDDLTVKEQQFLDRESFEAAASIFSFVVTPYYRNLIDQDDPDDPIRKMAFPSGEELLNPSSLKIDPICEEEHAVLPGLIRRYPDRALLILGNSCAVHCRHCTRRVLGKGKIVPISPSYMGRALEYLAVNPEIKDVIISGGDPLLFDDDYIIDVLRRVRSIPSVEIIRIGTRVPVALPMRITASFAKKIAEFSPLFVNTQFNHPRELTKESHKAVSALIDAGIPVNNQSVLLNGVNDDPVLMEQLSRGLLRERIRPYYLFICDLVDGTSHFRTTLQTGLDIISYLRGRISGMGIPELVIDLPGGMGKIPVNPNYIEKREGGKILFRSPRGELVEYEEPATIEKML